MGTGAVAWVMSSPPATRAECDRDPKKKKRRRRSALLELLAEDFSGALATLAHGGRGQRRVQAQADLGGFVAIGGGAEDRCIRVAELAQRSVEGEGVGVSLQSSIVTEFEVSLDRDHAGVREAAPPPLVLAALMREPTKALLEVVVGAFGVAEADLEQGLLDDLLGEVTLGAARDEIVDRLVAGAFAVRVSVEGVDALVEAVLAAGAEPRNTRRRGVLQRRVLGGVLGERGEERERTIDGAFALGVLYAALESGESSGARFVVRALVAPRADERHAGGEREAEGAERSRREAGVFSDLPHPSG
jgi:hypothetical protein